MSDLILSCPQHLKNELGLWEPNIEWLDAKLGIPSASSFKKILTPTGRLSKSRERYLATLLAEWALGQQWDLHVSKSEWVTRGLELEPQARAWYEVVYADVEEVGFVWRDEERMVGCSPDGLVGDDGMLELKCPAPGTHVLYLSNPALMLKDYWWQVQGQMWVAGREWCDIMSFCPGLPEVLERVRPDEKAFDALDTHMPVFVEEIREGRAALREKGVGPDEEDA